MQTNEVDAFSIFFIPTGLSMDKQQSNRDNIILITAKNKNKNRVAQFWKANGLVASLLSRSHVEPLPGFFCDNDGFCAGRLSGPFLFDRNPVCLLRPVEDCLQQDSRVSVLFSGSAYIGAGRTVLIFH